jgi:hypothetical protein
MGVGDTEYMKSRTGNKQSEQSRPLAGALRSFKEFSSQLKLSSRLSPLTNDQRDILLRKLYTAALMKRFVEHQLLSLPRNTRALKRYVKRFAKLRKLLERALKNLDDVADTYAEDLEACKMLMSRFGYTVPTAKRISRMRAELRKACIALTRNEWQYAASIHPNERRGNERRLAEQAKGRLFHPNFFPISRKESPQIDHVFIAQVAACLEPFEVKDRGPKRPPRTLATNAGFMCEVFRAAFGLVKEQKSVEKVLQREPKHERVFFVSPDSLEPYRDAGRIEFSAPFSLVMLGSAPFQTGSE